MWLMLKDSPVLKVEENGACQIIDFDRLPFALRKTPVSFPEFLEWAANRTLSIGRSYAKEILNSLRLSQTNRYAVCKACRGLSLEDAYWIRQEGDEKSWEEVSLFRNELTLFVAELALSGSSSHQIRTELKGLYEFLPEKNLRIHTPELTTLGTSAKGWIREADGLYLHKVGRYEVPASDILEALGIPHIPYALSEEEELAGFLSEERKGWLRGVGERMVKSRLFTSEDVSLVTFEEFRVFCEHYGKDPYEAASEIDRTSYLQMQIADYVLNNNDRHEQNWGFFMENSTGKLTGYCPLFDHDHAFSQNNMVMSQTVGRDMTLEEAARDAQRELGLDVGKVPAMERPELLEREAWEGVLQRCGNPIIFP